MNKNQFMQTLKQALPHVSPTELSDIMADFEEHFASGLAHGKSEAEICSELGSPYEIAQQYQEGWSAVSVPPAQPPAYKPSEQFLYPQAARAVIPEPASKPAAQINEGALIAVILLNLLIGIPIWVSLFSTLAGLWAAAGGIGIAAAFLFAAAIVQAGVTSLILALFGLSLTALTVLTIILMVYLTKWLCIGLVKYVRWNRNLVMGGSPA